MAQIFNGGFESGTTGAYASTQFGTPGVAPTVVTSPVAKGAYACRYEVRPGDGEFGGGHRCETISGDEPAYGSKRWYRLRFRLHEYGTSHWMIIWQAHDSNGASPPLALEYSEVDGKLHLLGYGGTYDHWSTAMPEKDTWHEVLIYAKYHETEGELSIKYDGVAQTMTGGGTTRTGIKTLTPATAPAYDKNGIYIGGSSAETVVYQDDYLIFNAEPSAGELEEETKKPAVPVKDVTTLSALAGEGTTTIEVSHEAAADASAAVVLCFGFGANKTDFTGAEYGGVAMSPEESDIKGEAPYPYTAIFFLNGIKTGTQTVKVTKNTSVKGRITVVTLRASGAVSVAAKNGKNSSGTTASVPALTSPEGGAFGLAIVAGGALPSSRSDTLLKQQNDTTAAMDVQYIAEAVAGSKSFTWTFGSTTKYASSGILLTGFPPVEPTAPGGNTTMLMGIGK